jgi:hypothetical protein
MSFISEVLDRLKGRAKKVSSSSAAALRIRPKSLDKAAET